MAALGVAHVLIVHFAFLVQPRLPYDSPERVMPCLANGDFMRFIAVLGLKQSRVQSIGAEAEAGAVG